MTWENILGALEPVGDIATIPQGVTIVHSGETARHVAVLLEGTVEEIIGTAVVTINRPGTLLGAERIFDDRAAVGTLRAVSRCSLLLVAPDQFRSVLDAGVGEWVLTHLNTRVETARAALVQACSLAAGAA